MSSVPAEIGGIGSTMQRLRVSPGFDPMKAQVGPDEYFLLSRIDGTQTLRDVLLSTGLPVERAVAIVLRLRSIGALLLPGETTAPPPASVPPPRTTPRATTATPSAPITPPRGVPIPAAVSGSGRTAQGTAPRPAATEQVAFDDPSGDELKALTEQNDLSDAERRRILAMARLVDKGPWVLLGIVQGADAKTIKRAYFKLSKDIHPDRYYGRQLGSFRERLSLVFEAVTRAYTRLTDPDKSGRLTVGDSAADDAPQSPQDYAAELFDRACALEVSGDALGAMKLFSASIRIDPQTKYLRRSASCALAAGQPRTALEHAKKAQDRSPSDPSLARLLATAFKACGKLAEAEEVLVMAMALKSENDVLMVELRNDLAEVRRLMNS